MPELRAEIGTVFTLPGATVAELLARPFDFVWVDLEHGALAGLDAQEVILGAQAAGARALVRLPADAYQPMTAMLDAGADGVVLADVRDAAAAAAAVERVSHPPDGVRGWGPRRLMYRHRLGANELPRPAVHAQIESAEGVESAAAIAATPGVEALVAGTADLSFALGAPLEMQSPSLLEAIESVRIAARGAGVGFGLAGAIDGLPPDLVREADQLVHSTDARICAGAVDGAVENLRAGLETRG